MSTQNTDVSFFSILEVSVVRCFGSGGGRARSPWHSAASNRPRFLEIKPETPATRNPFNSRQTWRSLRPNSRAAARTGSPRRSTFRNTSRRFSSSVLHRSRSAPPLLSPPQPAKKPGRLKFLNWTTLTFARWAYKRVAHNAPSEKSRITGFWKISLSRAYLQSAQRCC